LAAVLLGAGVAACARPGRRADADPAERSAFDGAVRFRVPKGWAPRASILREPGSVVLARDAGRADIVIQMRSGTPGTDSLVTALESPSIGDPDRASARPVGPIAVAGLETALKRRQSGGFREEPGQEPQFFTDEFCVVPLEGRFLLLDLRLYDHSMPPPSRESDPRVADWLSFLASVRAGAR
jgi:hypothetical protein